MPERQLVKYSEQKTQDYLTDKTRDGKSFLNNNNNTTTTTTTTTTTNNNNNLSIK